MTPPERDSLANGLVSIGEDAIATNNDVLLDDYFTDEGRLVEEWVQTDTYDFLRQLGAAEFVARSDT